MCTDNLLFNHGIQIGIPGIKLRKKNSHILIKRYKTVYLVHNYFQIQKKKQTSFFKLIFDIVTSNIKSELNLLINTVVMKKC
jgi:hypothetical protein